MKIGYARVSTDEQSLALQMQALKEAGCDVVHSDKASGASARRNGLRRALRKCGPDDVLIVWKLDRLGRSLIDLVQIVEQLNEKQAGLKILTGHGSMIDTTHPEGRMIFGLLAVLAEFERELIRERTIAGMKAARKRGVHVGRPRKLSADQLQLARRWLREKTHSYREAAEQLGVDASTLRRALATGI